MAKYHNKICVRDGFKFHSIKEGNFYLYLKDRQKKGEISYFLRQVPLHISPTCKYVADFLIFYPDGTHEYIDVKGMDTPTSRTKRGLVKDFFNIEVKIV